MEVLIWLGAYLLTVPVASYICARLGGDIGPLALLWPIVLPLFGFVSAMFYAETLGEKHRTR